MCENQSDGDQTHHLVLTRWRSFTLIALHIRLTFLVLHGLRFLFGCRLHRSMTLYCPRSNIHCLRPDATSNLPQLARRSKIIRLYASRDHTALASCIFSRLQCHKRKRVDSQCPISIGHVVASEKGKVSSDFRFRFAREFLAAVKSSRSKIEMQR